MYYRPSKIWCRRLGIPLGSVVTADVSNEVYKRRNTLYAVRVMLASDGSPVAKSCGMSGWKLAKRPKA